MPGEAPAALIPFFLGAASFSRLFELPVIEGFIVFALLYLTGFTINALADKEIDKKYTTFKSNISRAVSFLGERKLRAIIALHVITALAITAHIAYLMNNYCLIIFVGFTTFLGLGYSIEPFRFKVRGTIPHAFALGTAAFFAPLVFLYWIIAGELTLLLVMFALAFTVVHYAMEFGNQAIDYLEDKEDELKTPTVRLGMENSLKVAVVTLFAGFVFMFSVLYLMVAESNFSYLYPGSQLPIYILMVAILLGGYYVPSKGLWSMLFITKSARVEHKPLEDVMPTLREKCKYARWQTSGIIGVVLVSALFFGAGFTYDMIKKPPESEGIGDVYIQEPNIEYFYDEETIYANLSISVINHGKAREPGSLVLYVESRVGFSPLPIGYNWTALDRALNANEIWSVALTLNVHDRDDTAFRIILRDVSIDEPLDVLEVPSDKDLYIIGASYTHYNDLIVEEYNVSIDVFNDGMPRGIEEVTVTVDYYLDESSLTPALSKSVSNDEVINTDEIWNVTVTFETLSIDDSNEPIFKIRLEYNQKEIDSATATEA